MCVINNFNFFGKKNEPFLWLCALLVVSMLIISVLSKRTKYGGDG